MLIDKKKTLISQFQYPVYYQSIYKIPKPCFKLVVPLLKLFLNII